MVDLFASVGSLVNFHNVELKKVTAAGYRTVADLLEASPEMLSEKTAISIVIVNAWQSKLRAHSLCSPVSGWDLYSREKRNGSLYSVGVLAVDKVFGELFRSSEIVEFCGGPLSGKTQFCLQIALHTVRTSSKKVLYIDTTGQLSARRLKKMCKSLGDTPNKFMNLLECIYTVRITNIYRLFQFLDFLPKWNGAFAGAEDEFFISEPPDIVIIDSLYALLAPWLGSKVDQGYGYSLINQMASALKCVASETGVLIIYTNLMPLVVPGMERHANLGNFWQSVPNHRLGLEIIENDVSNHRLGNGRVQRCRLVRTFLMKSTKLPTGSEAKFMVNEQGLCDVPEEVTMDEMESTELSD